MNKKQVFEVMQEIQSYYDRFEISQEKIDAWHKILHDKDQKTILDNLQGYILANRFPPAISDVLNPPAPEKDRFVPGTKQTKEYLKNLDKANEKAAQDPDREKKKIAAQDKIRKMLNLRG